MVYHRIVSDTFSTIQNSQANLPLFFFFFLSVFEYYIANSLVILNRLHDVCVS